MSLRRLAHLSGCGRLESEISDANQPLLVPTRVVYELDEFQDMIAAGDHDNPTDTLGGPRELRGRLSGFQKGQHVLALPALSTTWTLHLEDGRRMKFIVEGIDSKSVAVRSTGGFF